MTKRKKALRFPGDRRGEIQVGELVGPGDDGLWREVTSVTYDGRRNRTLVEVKQVMVAPEGHRLVYYGDVTGAGPEPDAKPAAQDTIEPR